MSPIIHPPLTGHPPFPLEPGIVYLDRELLSGGIDEQGNRRWLDRSLSRGTEVPTITRHDDGRVEVRNGDKDYRISVAPLPPQLSSREYYAVVAAAKHHLEPDSETGVLLEPGRSYRIAVAPNYVVVVTMPLEVAEAEHSETTTRKRVDDKVQETLAAIERVREYLDQRPDYRRTLAIELQQYILGRPAPVRLKHETVKRALYGPNVSDVHREVWKKITNGQRPAGSPDQLITFLLSYQLLTIDHYREAIEYIKRRR